MFTTQRLRTRFSRVDPAQSARARLLNDPAMRRNLPTPACAQAARHPAPITFAPLSADLVRSQCAAALSRAEQMRRARQVAQSFRQHYLAGIAYHTEQQVALATIRPKKGVGYASETPHQIRVEANGNVSVVHFAGAHLPEQHLILHRLFLLLASLMALLGTLFTLVLM